MKTLIPSWSALCVGACMLLAASCAYDSTYSSTTYGGGFGYGHGWGGSSFNTSYFISTGSPRWAYDPYCGAYFDFRRRAYYDPFLYGYYPVGYRPPLVIGAPHPYGWRPGLGYCPPPRRITNVTLVNYHRRPQLYSELDQPWSNQVRVGRGENWHSEPQRPQFELSRPQAPAADVGPGSSTAPTAPTAAGLMPRRGWGSASSGTRPDQTALEAFFSQAPSQPSRGWQREEQSAQAPNFSAAVQSEPSSSEGSREPEGRFEAPPPPQAPAAAPSPPAPPASDASEEQEASF